MKQKQQIIALVALVIVAALVWRFELRQQTPSTITATFIQDLKGFAVDNPGIRWAELERAQKTEYKSNGRNPFSIIAPLTSDQLRMANSNKPKDPPAPAPLPPPPPSEAHLPANLKFFGYGTIPNGTPRRAFFTDGEDTYIVTEGDTLLGRYRILKVGNTNLQFQEISTGLPGTTPLEEQAAPPSA
jgi:hypothetical protein